MGLKARVHSLAPAWVSALVFRVGCWLDPSLGRRSPLAMCTSVKASRPTEVPSPYSLQTVWTPEPPAGWMDTLGSAGITVGPETWLTDFGKRQRARVILILQQG